MLTTLLLPPPVFQVFIDVGVVDDRLLLGGVIGDVPAVANDLVGTAVRVRALRFQRPTLGCQHLLKYQSMVRVQLIQLSLDKINQAARQGVCRSEKK